MWWFVMAHILLLGAGFSRNWGGLLASEFFDRLIGMREIREDNYLREVLWNTRNGGGYENALSIVQAAFIQNPQNNIDHLHRLQNAISIVLQDMNRAFLNMQNMEFQRFRETMLRTFMFRFDAIFTLNQDILLEGHYCPHVELGDVRRWGGSQLPGMWRIPVQQQQQLSSWARDTWEPLQPDQFQIDNNLQPYFKLHGSSNWKDNNGGELLVIGGDKSRTIRSLAILSWYYEIFQQYLNQPDSKLFIVGYGFRDTHINEAIINAVNRGLEFFVVDPLGSDIVRRVNPSFGGAIYAPNELDEAFTSGLIGASERRLSETFGGNDMVSHANVMQFFN